MGIHPRKKGMCRWVCYFCVRSKFSGLDTRVPSVSNGISEQTAQLMNMVPIWTPLWVWVSTRPVSKGYLFQQAPEAWHTHALPGLSFLLFSPWNSLLKFNPSPKIPFQILLSPCSFSPFLQMDPHSTLLFFYTSYFIPVICILVSPARLYAPSLLFVSSAESSTGLCTQRSINIC